MRRCSVPVDLLPAASCDAVSKTHVAASGPVHAVREASLTVPPGALTLLMGPSGSGKSTLLRVLACTDRPDSGSVHVGESEVTALPDRARRALRRTEIGYVFSRPSDNLLPYLTAREQVDLAAQLRGAPRSAADGLLERLGLASRVDAHPDDMSGGERQRLAFAAAAVGTPRLLVADEPTAELDAASVVALLDVLRELATAGSGVLVATHDPRLLPAADQVVHIAAGHISS
jgi:putative ABC transport system ATP-binding protein